MKKRLITISILGIFVLLIFSTLSGVSVTNNLLTETYDDSITYNPEKDCPTIKKHFQTVLKTEDDVKVMQEIVGFLLLKEYENLF